MKYTYKEYKELMELPKKKYKIIYADPPWSYDRKVGQGVACEQYDTMDIEDIKNLPIKRLADDDCALFIWVTFPKLNEGLEVIKAWGFTLKTVAFNWIKTNSDGSPFFGIGFYTKSNGEICILATKGKTLKVLDNSISQIVMSRKSKHSSKPHICYSMIERLFGDLPRIELFARTKREGWDAWGNEVPKEEQRLLKKVTLYEQIINKENQSLSEGKDNK